jgi:hypothetical protein
MNGLTGKQFKKIPKGPWELSLCEPNNCIILACDVREYPAVIENIICQDGENFVVPVRKVKLKYY